MPWGLYYGLGVIVPRVDGLSTGGLSTTSYGKVAEHLATVELLRRGHSVALPVADDDGVDLVVNYRWRVQVKNAARRALTPKPGYSYEVFAWTSKRKWREADFFALHGDGRWFVVPASFLADHGKTLLSYRDATRGVAARLLEFEDAWDLLADEQMVDLRDLCLR